MIQGVTKGIKSTEFWISMLGMVGGIICAVFAEAQWAQVAGAILSAVCGKSYADSRKTVKAALALGGAKVDAARIAAEATEAVGKPKE
tara:strand:- start:330 stop:593 length:264 start_codon:yes stop_codon:yes gene_type:complete